MGSEGTISGSFEGLIQRQNQVLLDGVVEAILGTGEIIISVQGSLVSTFGVTDHTYFQNEPVMLARTTTNQLVVIGSGSTGTINGQNPPPLPPSSSFVAPDLHESIIRVVAKRNQLVVLGPVAAVMSDGAVAVQGPGSAPTVVAATPETTQVFNVGQTAAVVRDDSGATLVLGTTPIASAPTAPPPPPAPPEEPPQAPPMSTATTLEASVRDMVEGDTVTLTATVASVPSGSSVPDGHVTFLDGSSVVGAGTLDSSGHVSIIVTLGAGDHSLTAHYMGTTAFAPSASPVLVETVHVPDPGITSTVTTLTSSDANTVIGSSIIFTASVTTVPVGGVPTGTITFVDGSVVIARVPLISGASPLILNSLELGDHRIKAIYSGDVGFDVSESDVLVQTIHSMVDEFHGVDWTYRKIFGINDLPIPEWVEDAYPGEFVVGTTYSPSVVFFNGKYVMAFGVFIISADSRGGDFIALAESANGIDWTFKQYLLDPDHEVITTPAVDQPDGTICNVNDASLIVIGSNLYMLHSNGKRRSPFAAYVDVGMAVFDTDYNLVFYNPVFIDGTANQAAEGYSRPDWRWLSAVATETWFDTSFRWQWWSALNVDIDVSLNPTAITKQADFPAGRPPFTINAFPLDLNTPRVDYTRPLVLYNGRGINATQQLKPTVWVPPVEITRLTGFSLSAERQGSPWLYVENNSCKLYFAEFGPPEVFPGLGNPGTIFVAIPPPGRTFRFMAN